MKRTVKPNESSYEGKKKKEPFCWIEKAKLRMIEDIFTENRGLGSLESARSIYLALCEIASDFGRDDNLEISQEAIARRAGLARSTANRILPVFARLRLIRIKGKAINGMRTRSIYTLVRGKLPLSVKQTTLSEATKTKRTVRKNSSKKASKGTARMANNVVSATCSTSLADNKENEYERTW
jgi:hypothetical protein